VANPEWQRWWTWKEARAWVETTRSSDALERGGKAWVRMLGKNEEFAKQIMEESEMPRVFGDGWPALRDSFQGGDPIKWLEDRLLATKRGMMEYPIAIARKRGRDCLREEPKICVGSVHSVKGGEADVVYLLPDLSPSGMREWTRYGDGRDQIIRCFYVAMTRARERLVLASRWSSASVNWNG
jgi:superfamily I DNA/RNA helicase